MLEFKIIKCFVLKVNFFIKNELFTETKCSINDYLRPKILKDLVLGVVKCNNVNSMNTLKFTTFDDILQLFYLAF